MELYGALLNLYKQAMAHRCGAEMRTIYSYVGSGFTGVCGQLDLVCGCLDETKNEMK